MTCNPVTQTTTLAFIPVAMIAAILFALSSTAHADTIVSVPIVGTGGSGGSGTSASDMVYNQYNTNGDGWGWAGGAGAVQGNAAVNNSGGSTVPANEAFNFNIGSTIDSLNAEYGVGGWEISSSTLSFASSYAKQNNSRFGVGSGDFNIFWVANNTWYQSAGTPTNRGTNPIFANSAPQLLTWSGTQSLLGSEAFTVPQGGSGYVDLAYPLANDPTFENAVYSATGVGNVTAKEYLSLYLMDTTPAVTSGPDSLGMIIFTGGQGQPLPTLTIDATAVPEPASLALLAAGAMALAGCSLCGRRKRSP